MKILLNGEEMPYAEDLPEKIATQLQEQNLVICSLVVNGTEMVNTSLSEVFAEPAKGKVVEIETCPAEELLQQSMAYAREYIPKLLAGLPQIRERLLEGDLQAVHAMVDAVLEGLEWLGLTFHAFIAQGASPEQEKVFIQEYARLGEIMKELEVALRMGTMEVACDIFEQQVTPFLEKMQVLAEELQ